MLVNHGQPLEPPTSPRRALTHRLLDILIGPQPPNSIHHQRLLLFIIQRLPIYIVDQSRGLVVAGRDVEVEREEGGEDGLEGLQRVEETVGVAGE